MKLIDADALKEEVKTMFCPDGYKIMMLQCIDNAPTVDTYNIEDIQEVRENALILGAKLAQRPQGEWKKTINGFHICSLCGKYGNPNFFNFCSNCGAKMMKGGAE